MDRCYHFDSARHGHGRADDISKKKRKPRAEEDIPDPVPFMTTTTGGIHAQDDHEQYKKMARICPSNSATEAAVAPAAQEDMAAPSCVSLCARCGGAHGSHEENDARSAMRPYIDRYGVRIRVSRVQADLVRSSELFRVVSQKKLHLVLDIDHTLLNSASFSCVDREEEAYLHSLLENQSLGDGSLHRLEDLRMWTKLRPHVRQFLAAASEMFEMTLYTMGTRKYAEAIARLLDPEGKLFEGRVISRNDSICPKAKDLDITFLSDSATVILDDTMDVWRRHVPNVVVMKRYLFFRCSSGQAGGGKMTSLTDLKLDEGERDVGALSHALWQLRQLHSAYFQGEYVSGGRPQSRVHRRKREEEDVREILKEMRKGVLEGCKIAFSWVLPVNMGPHENTTWWRIAEQLGATCSRDVDPTVTHVVAKDAGTEKAKWALQHGRHLVHPNWLRAAVFCGKHLDEVHFPIADVAMGATQPSTCTSSSLISAPAAARLPYSAAAYSIKCSRMMTRRSCHTVPMQQQQEAQQFHPALVL